MLSNARISATANANATSAVEYTKLAEHFVHCSTDLVSNGVPLNYNKPQFGPLVSSEAGSTWLKSKDMKLIPAHMALTHRDW